MAELRKQWNDGELLTVTYDGDRSDSATFTSDVNESIDREMTVTYVDDSRMVREVQTIRQIGLREVLRASDGVLLTSDGQTLNVLKE